MKTYAAIAIFLAQFLIAAGSESILSASSKSDTKRYDDLKEAELERSMLKPKKGYQCRWVRYCKNIGGKVKCFKKPKCYRPRPTRPRPRCRKYCSNRCTKSNPPKCMCKIVCTTVSYKWLIRRTKPKLPSKVGKPYKRCFRRKAKKGASSPSKVCYTCTRRPYCKSSYKGRKRCYMRPKCIKDKKETPKKEEKKETPKKEDKKETPKKEEKKETPKKEEKEETPKKEEYFEERLDEQTMDLNSAIDMIDTIPDKDVNQQVHDEIKKGDIKAAENIVHEYFETYVSKMDGEEKAEMMANKSKILAALDVAVEHYNDDK